MKNGNNKIRVLGIILARGGSKSIPHKNIAPCAGNPLLYYTAMPAEKARVLGALERVIISTDDEEIANVARKYNIEVPFMRPKELAEDLTPDLPVIKHALMELQKKDGYVPEIIVHLRPTTPLKATSDIIKAIELLENNPDADSVRSICPPSHTPFKMYRLDDGEKFLKPILTKEYPEVFAKYPEAYNMPRHSLPAVWRHSGYVDAIRYDTLMKLDSMSGKKILSLTFPQWRDIDIDSMEELKQAESVILSLREKGKEPWQD